MSNTTLKGIYNGHDPKTKMIFIDKALLPISDVAITYLENIEKYSEVTATLKDGKVQFVKLESPPVKVTDTPSKILPQKKKYQGVTLGMAINNATQIVLKKLELDKEMFPPKELAEVIMIQAEALLEEMDKRGL